MRYPPAKTVRRVIEHLEKDLGLSVYGQRCDLKDGQVFPSLMDYSIDDVLKYRQLVRKDQLWEMDEH